MSEASSRSPKIDAYRFGRIVIDGVLHTKDVILLPGRVIAGWWRQEGHALHPQDLEAVFAARPRVLVIGQGAYSRMRVTEEAKQALSDHGIDCLILPTEQACQAYNQLCAAGEAAAALHLTC